MTSCAGDNYEMWWDRLLPGWAAMAKDDPGEPASGRRSEHGGPHPGRRRGRGLRAGAWRGFEPGLGPGPGFGSWARRAGRAARGDVRTAVLALLTERPRHGYEIIQEITARSEGRWRPSPGSVYPTIAQLEDEGMVRTEQTEGRRMVHLTEQGRRYADEHAVQFAAVFKAADNGTDDARLGLADVAGQVATATAQVAQAGTDHQISQAREVLAETRRRLYRILAEDPDTTRP
ncbi:MAG: PadR family transcriptional regulator [Pseudonocardiaceae bacterium]